MALCVLPDASVLWTACLRSRRPPLANWDETPPSPPAFSQKCLWYFLFSLRDPVLLSATSSAKLRQGTSVLHPLLHFFTLPPFPMQLQKSDASDFFPPPTAAVTSRHKLRQVVSSLPSLPSANLPMTWHCIAWSVFLYQSAPLSFSKVVKYCWEINWELCVW